jgi:hypothetical protein
VLPLAGASCPVKRNYLSVRSPTKNPGGLDEQQTSNEKHLQINICLPFIEKHF